MESSNNHPQDQQNQATVSKKGKGIVWKTALAAVYLVVMVGISDWLSSKLPEPFKPSGGGTPAAQLQGIYNGIFIIIVSSLIYLVYYLVSKRKVPSSEEYMGSVRSGLNKPENAYIATGAFMWGFMYPLCILMSSFITIVLLALISLVFGGLLGSASTTLLTSFVVFILIFYAVIFTFIIKRWHEKLLQKALNEKQPTTQNPQK